jgi:transposase
MGQYRELWKIEKAFRISKTVLKVRPICHRLQRRIEAHICISFVAYKIYKELERQLLLRESHINVERAIGCLKTIYRVTIVHPPTGLSKTLIHTTTKDQDLLLKYYGIRTG